MPLTVVTHTRFDRPEQLARNIRSVEAALPKGARHKIVACYGDHGKARYEAALCDEFVAFVDDDDTIDPASLSLCLNAIQEYGVGVAFTDEAVVDNDLNILQVCGGARTYDAMYVNPRTIHHLAVFRSFLIDNTMSDMHRAYGGAGMDWFLKVCAATKGGAIHVPITGYFWTSHPLQATKLSHGSLYAEYSQEILNEFQSRWQLKRGTIPMADLS